VAALRIGRVLTVGGVLALLPRTPAPLGIAKADPGAPSKSNAPRVVAGVEEEPVDGAAVGRGGSAGSPPPRRLPFDTLGPPRPAVLSRAQQAQLWSSRLTPAAGPAEAIGGYAAGCVRGAVPLPEKASRYCFAHPERKRWFGHPALIAYIERLAGLARTKRLGPLLVGDLAQARGGPAPTGHRSHQSGLDVDLGYVAAEPTAPGSSVAKNSSPGHVGPDVVDLTREKLTRLWSPRVRALLILAASDPAVDRVFVHPLIKRELCRARGEDPSWLPKLRPWWGHQDHFHVRLRCPEGSPACENQRSVEGDGCGEELEHWFKKKLPVRPTVPPPRTEPAPPRRDELLLPPACQTVLDSVLEPSPP
jgi:penicillin-insensitive murein endopeptidase